MGAAENDGNFDHHTGGSLSQLRIGTSATHWRANLADGTHTGDSFGLLTFAGTDATQTAGDAAYDAAATRFNAGQTALVYPKWMVGGIRLEDIDATANPSGTGDRWSLIMVFEDGSTAMISENSAFGAAVIGTPGNPASGWRAQRYDGDPLLSDRPDLLWTEYGQAWSKPLPTADGGGETNTGWSALGGTIGTGGPSESLAALAKTFLEENDYVNVAMEDPTARKATLDGMFVGADQDGPLGLIGTWSLTGGAFGVGVERAPIRGAFGADIQP